MSQRVLLMLLGLAVALAGVGCANPADDKPAAEVTEAVPAEDRPAAGKRFVLTEDSKIGFVGSKVTGSHEGGFEYFEGSIVLVNGDPTQSSVEVKIDATSLWADNDRLAGHLKSADFFEVETYPTAKFISTEIAKEGDGYMFTGNLELHGVTKSVRFPASISIEPERVTANAEFSIKRFDFGIAYPGKADDLIRDEVVIKLDLVAVPA